MSSSTVTGLEILDMALAQAEMSDSDFVTNGAGLAWVNQALAELHDLLVDVFEDFFLATHAFEISADEQLLPDDFLKSYRLFDTSDGEPIAKLTLAKLLSLRASPSSTDELCYRIMGTRVIFTRVPNVQVEMWYAPQAQKLRDLGEAIRIPVPVSWLGFLVADITARALAQEESSFVFYEGRKMQFAERIRNTAANRDLESEPIEDVEPTDFLEL